MCDGLVAVVGKDALYADFTLSYCAVNSSCDTVCFGCASGIFFNNCLIEVVPDI